MKNRIMKPSNFISLLISVLLCMGFYACNKDDGYNSGNNGGDNTGNKVSINNMAFSVATLTVSSGTTVTWTNNDGMTHTVTADDGSFNSGNIAPGESFSHTFSGMGTYAYHCYIHSNMKASIVVNY